MRFILSAILIVSSLQAMAADPKADPHAGHQMDPKMMEMMKVMQQAGTPGEQHKMLAGYAGNWTYTGKMWHKPDQAPQETSGTAKFEMVLDGRWLKQEFKGEMMGQPFTGLGYLGYNNATKEYETSFMDTMSTGSMHGKGSYDKSKKTIAESGQYYCPIKKGMREYRGEWKFVDKNTMMYTMYGTGMEDQPEFKQMELNYKRSR